MAFRSDRDSLMPPPRKPLLFAAIVLYLVSTQIAVCLSGIGPALNGQADFRALYTAGYIVRTHRASQLYDLAFEQQMQSAVVTPRSAALPFVYPPFCSLLFVPLSLLSYRNAYFTLFFINTVFAMAAAAMLHRHLGTLVAIWSLFPFALVVCFFPVAVALIQGQISLVLLMLYCGVYSLLKADWPFLAGVLLSFTLIKFQIAIPVAFLFLIWRQWHLVGGFVSGTTLLTVESAATTGVPASLSYLKSLFHIANAISAGVGNAQYGMFPERMPNLHGFVAEILSRSSVPLVTLMLTALVSLLVFIWAARRPASLPLALLVAMLVGYHLQPHDLTLMLLPLGLAAEAWVHRRRGSATPLQPAGESRFLKTLAIAGLLSLVPPLPLLLMGKQLTALLALPVSILAIWIASQNQSATVA